jgi:C-terminal processing protease CtpA/Prc
MWCMRILALMLAGLFTFTAVPGAAAPAPAPATREDALVALCRLWNAVRFTHPAVASESDANWEDALLAAEPIVERDPGALHQAAATMLAALHDPLTTVDSAGTSTKLPTAADQDGVHIVSLNGYPTEATAAEYGKSLTAALGLPASERALVVDLRGSGPASAEQILYLQYMWSKTPIIAKFAGETVAMPDFAQRYFLGFAPEDGVSSGSYFEGRETVESHRVIAPAGDARTTFIAFVADGNALVPREAIALQRAGRAAIFSTDGSSGVSPGSAAPFDAGAGVTAVLRTSAPLETTTVRRGALDAALAWLRDPKPVAVSVVPLPPPPPTPDKRFASTALPDEPHRVLAAFRIWGTIEYVYPYKALMHDDWDAALAAGLADLHRVTTPLDYALALMKMYAHTHDSHSFVAAPAIRDAYRARPAFRAREVEGRPTIVRVDPVAAKRDGFAVGDVIEAVDGETVAARSARLRPYIAASTEQSARELLDGAGTIGLFRGPADTSVALRLRGADGRARNVRTARVEYQAALDGRTRPAVDVLPGNIGYVDLTRLQQAGVDPMFKRLAGTRALVFDLRGYPEYTFHLLGPHFTSATVSAALFRTPMSHGAIGVPNSATAFGRIRPQTRDFDQLINPAPPRYAKPVVVVIDSRAISRAEHTGLFLAASAHARFVGEPTMGADGDVTSFFVPGGVQLSFTGQAVLHPDGAQLQRVGLVPDVRVSQTLRGVRAGEDELLTAGVREALRLSGADVHTTLTALSVERARERADALAQLAIPKLVPLTAAALPDAFAVRGEGYDGSHDTAVRHVDGRTIVLRAKPGTPASGFGTYMESIPADAYRGKRVRVSGYLRSSDVTSAGFWLRVDGPGGVQAFDNMESRAMTGTRDWTAFAIVLDVQADALTLKTGLLLMGAGTVWADDLRIDVVDPSVATTGAS